MSKNFLFIMVMVGMLFTVGCEQINRGGVVTTKDMIYQMPGENIVTRWYSYENVNADKGAGGQDQYGRKGAASVTIPAGDSHVMVDAKGSGTIRRIWFTLWDRKPKDLQGLRIEMYWDGAKTPAVSGPVGDFFCHSWGHMVRFENEFFSSGEGRNFNCCIPMPFKKGAKIVMVNESGRTNRMHYEVDVTLGDEHGDDMLYFHSFWSREDFDGKPRSDKVILPYVQGRGRFLGCHLGVKRKKSTKAFWWGEGEVKIYLDGDGDFPTLCGTGTEDYVSTAYGQGVFGNMYHGNQFLSENEDAYGFYRLHVPDPVYFHEDIRVTIQVMAGAMFDEMSAAMESDKDLKLMKTGKGDEYFTLAELKANPQGWSKIEAQDDWFAMAYWYMDKPENALGAIAGAKERMSDLP
ncbi:MAG: DUF2961 domain-containing protein [Planctomycetes bacterium]|nr:DUF2961 domain-containing protein [Planctomycetota bacterium]